MWSSNKAIFNVICDNIMYENKKWIYWVLNSGLITLVIVLYEYKNKNFNIIWQSGPNIVRLHINNQSKLSTFTCQQPIKIEYIFTSANQYIQSRQPIKFCHFVGNLI
jgi:hypothetical protein